MGEAELQPHSKLLIIHATIIIYGDAANDILAKQIADRKSTRLNSSHLARSRMPSSA